MILNIEKIKELTSKRWSYSPSAGREVITFSSVGDLLYFIDCIEDRPDSKDREKVG